MNKLHKYPSTLILLGKYTQKANPSIVFFTRPKEIQQTRQREAKATDKIIFGTGAAQNQTAASSTTPTISQTTNQLKREYIETAERRQATFTPATRKPSAREGLGDVCVRKVVLKAQPKSGQEIRT
ncbi:hypothetical protein [Synechococcus sp. MU1625]|uniref:hypothetical protein n=1 Tax=Synechococcus sp. MU1625 TaxID=2508347 RepID=UPI001CF8E215|nr:hypothetical protein [Synechococcus sp. MU1625]MCB4400788.1 hypothetical protein [Synechococcus sp. MU1625]